MEKLTQLDLLQDAMANNYLYLGMAIGAVGSLLLLVIANHYLKGKNDE